MITDLWAGLKKKLCDFMLNIRTFCKHNFIFNFLSDI